jgi:hypothetical protein
MALQKNKRKGKNLVGRRVRDGSLPSCILDPSPVTVMVVLFVYPLSTPQIPPMHTRLIYELSNRGYLMEFLPQRSSSL